MPYRFRRKETAVNGVRRIIREQVAAIISLLADHGNNVAGRIHEARRHIKRVRSLLCLVCKEADEKAIAHEDKVLRFAAKRLSRSRDAEVCLATFEALAGHHKSPANNGIRILLRERSERAHRTAATPSQLLAIATTVRESGHRLAGISFSADDWQLFSSGLEDAYRDARKLRKLTGKKAGDKEFHDWRKRIKRLFFQLDLIRDFLGKSQRRVVKYLDKLGDVLGEHHDLDLLAACFRDLAAHGIAQDDSRSAEKLASKRRKKLKRKIEKLAKEAFVDGSKRFMAKAREGWKSCRKKD